MSAAIPKTMRAFVIERFGEPGEIREVRVPTIGEGDLQVRVHAAGVNPLDLKIRAGAKARSDVRFPFILGQDAAGVVVQTGGAVSSFGVGAAVFGAFWMAGSFAEYVRVPALRVAVSQKPCKIDFTSAAAVPTPALAAITAVKAVDLRCAQKILIVGATGGVGGFAVQMASKLNAHVIATARPDAASQMRKLGAAETIDYSNVDLVAAIRAAHPDGVDAIVDVVSDRDKLLLLCGALRRDGRLVSTIHSADTEVLAQRGIRATNVDIFGTTGCLPEVGRLIDDDGVTVPIHDVLPLERAADALARLQAGHTRGKIVLMVAESPAALS